MCAATEMTTMKSGWKMRLLHFGTSQPVVFLKHVAPMASEISYQRRTLASLPWHYVNAAHNHQLPVMLFCLWNSTESDLAMHGLLTKGSWGATSCGVECETWTPSNLKC